MSKAAPLLDAIGALDESGAAVGLARALLLGRTRNSTSVEPTRNHAEQLDTRLRELQDMLFRVGADMSTPLSYPKPPAPRITADDTKTIEQHIDALDETLPELQAFILPGGTDVAAAVHLARAIIRRAERALVLARDGGEDLNPNLLPFLNRLSSYCFALARLANHAADYKEEYPRYTHEERKE